MTKQNVTCRDGVRVLMDVTEGRLPARRCQGFVASYRATPGILRRATAERLPSPLGRRLRRIVASLPGRRT